MHQKLQSLRLRKPVLSENPTKSSHPTNINICAVKFETFWHFIYSSKFHPLMFDFTRFFEKKSRVFHVFANPSFDGSKMEKSETP